jgi:hypothetical protein
MAIGRCSGNADASFLFFKADAAYKFKAHATEYAFE